MEGGREGGGKERRRRAKEVVTVHGRTCELWEG